MNDRMALPDIGTANLRFARGLVDALQAAGVASAVVCPGSRSSPLAVAIAEHPLLSHSAHIDERSAAFYALGLAKATARPVALLCTSGTAAANFLPAVAEAHHARVPLVLLTADRPPELRAWGAPQTMEHRGLFAGFTRWFEDAPCPGEREAELVYAAALARRAVSEATGAAPGPVHLNLPFREPLLPATLEPWARSPRETPPCATPGPSCGLDFETLAADLRGVARGVLLFGPDSWDGALAESAQALAESLAWPLLADPASGLRAGTASAGAVLHGADLMLRDPDLATELEPELIVRFGGAPTSATITRWMARHATVDVWLVDQATGFRDPQHRASRLFRATPREFCSGLAARRGPAAAAAPSWRGRWRQAEQVTRAAVASALDREPAFLTPHLARSLWSTLPDGAALYAANSMVIREIDAFAGPRPGRLRLLANRGVNGIDGLLSSALGAAAGLRTPMVLWCGDLAFLHDVAGLLAGRLLDANLTVVVSNDDGGGIFEYLPVARALARPQFERVFSVSHGTDLCALARGCGWQALRVESEPALADALSRALNGGRHVIEVPVDRAVNTAFHLHLHDAVRAALRRERRP